MLKLLRGNLKLIFVVFFVFVIKQNVFAQVPEDMALDVSATTKLHTSDTARTIVTIQWSASATTPVTSRYRYKAKNSTLWSSFVVLTASATSFIDTITTGIEREYQVLVDTSGISNDYYKWGNILVGRKVPATLQHGRLLVLIDSAYLNVLDSMLNIYKHDLIADGYIPVFKYVSNTNSVVNIKQHIRDAYAITSTKLFGVVLLGNVPVPYSGDFKGTGGGYYPPDGHTTVSSPPSHEGAWATDLYYGDMSAASLWTDVSVNNSLGARAANNNTVGDGKFDQTVMPSAIELPVGRVDLTDLPIFAESDTQLMIRYLSKNHNYRSGQVSFTPRVLQDDELGLVTGEPFGGNSYQIANPIWGDSVAKLDWNSDLQGNSYQWAQGYGYGAYDQCVNVVSSSNFATNTYKATFTSLFGSYFGDFDISNNLLRAALASKGEILTSVWSGRPKWYFHQMGTGNPIGLSTLMSQNTWNGFYPVYPDALYGYGLIHPTFHGDVSLKLYPYEAPANLTVVQDSCNNRFILRWNRHADGDVLNYVVQRSKSLDSSFLNLTISTTDTMYVDSFPNSGMNYYMVRAVTEVENNSGMHYNLSHGIIDSIVYQVHEAYAGNDTSICQGLDVTLGTGYTYDATFNFEWSSGSNLNDSSIQQPVYIVGQTQSFTMHVTNPTTNCERKDTMVVTSNALPLDSIIPPVSTNACGDTSNLQSSLSGLGKTYNWQFAGGSPTSISGNGLAGPHEVYWTIAGNYKILMEVTDNANSCTKFDSIDHTVACILPVDLLSFTADYGTDCKTITANWVSLSELNLTGYYLAYYAKGSFINKVFQNSEGSGLHTQTSYTYAYALAGQEIDEIRLLEVDNNGTELILAVAPIFPGDCQKELTIYPNPLYLNLNNSLKIEGTKGFNSIEIHNSMGALVKRINLSGRESAVELNLQQSLSAGIYFITMGGKTAKLVVY